MPRSERPLDSDDDGVLTRFAADLRRLRDKAGGPPYRELGRRAHYSATTLADAAGGRKLPSLPVTLAYVRACGGDPGEWEERWRETAAELAERNAERPGAENPGEPCPYVGLAAFQPDDSELFFGREQLTEDLVSRVSADHFCAVFGASGSGKSSLLRAGLMSWARSVGMPTLLITPGPHPLEECAGRLAALCGGSAVAVHRELTDNPRALHLRVLQAVAGRPGDVDLLLVVDQFEEVFTLCADPVERAAFITALLTAARAANSRVRVVLGVRADFYAHCSEHPDLVDALRGTQLLVGPMTAEELRCAITSPATHAHCAVESALLTAIVADATGQANVLPMVSHALRETWQRRRGNTLTLAAYQASGGIRHALARTAESVYSDLPPEARAPVRGVFLRMIAPGDTVGATKRRIPRDQLDPGLDGVLDVLAKARLITIDAETVEITHEALLHAWPRLRDWVDADRAGLRVHQQLTDAATEWRRTGRDASVLYRGARLTDAREWGSAHVGDLAANPVESEFLAASIRQQRRAGRRRRVAVALLAALALLASAAAGLAFQQRAAARAERDRAVFEQILAEANDVGLSDSSLAAQLRLAAYRLAPLPQAATALLGTENIPLSTRVAGHTQAAYAVAFSPDGRLVATGAGDDTIRLWDVTDPGHPTPVGAPLRGHGSWVYWLAFSPDGRTLASASRDQSVRLWDVTDPARATPVGAPLTGHGDYVFSVSFSPDGRTLASAGHDHTVRLWDVADPAHARALGAPLVGNADSVASAAYSPDGRTVASAGHDHTVRLWNVTDPSRPVPWGPPLTAGGETVYAVAFSPDSHLLAAVGADRMVRLWDITDPAHPQPVGAPLAGHADVILGVSFSHDGRTLATGAADHTVRLWDVSDPSHAAPLGPPLLGHDGIVNWVAFSPDDRVLASVGDDRALRLWHLPRTGLTGHVGAVDALAYRPDGRVLASAGADGAVRLWDISGPAGPRPLGRPLLGHTDAVTRVAFGPDGRILASAGADHTVRLWDVSTPDSPRLVAVIPAGDTGSGGALAFSPDGRKLATDGAGHTIELWDVTVAAHPRPTTALAGQISATTWVGFAPDGRTVAATSADDKVRLWRPAKPDAPTVIATGDTDGLLWAAFRPDGRVLAIAGAGHAVYLWDLADPAGPRRLGRPLTGHASAVTWVGFGPDGRTAASTGADGTVRLWDVSDPARPGFAGSLTAGHVGAIDAAGFGAGGRTLATAGDDGAVQLTTMDVSAAVSRICASTGGNLDAEQWDRYVGELRFDPPCHR